jgi:hypothetical protein
MVVTFERFHSRTVHRALFWRAQGSFSESFLDRRAIAIQQTLFSVFDNDIADIARKLIIMWR